MRIVFITFLHFFTLTNLNSQTWQWASQCQNSSGDYSDGTAMCVDAAGNIVVAGEYSGTLTAGSYTVTGTRDYYIKYNSAGNVQWARTPIGNTASPTGAIADAFGNYYFTGTFNGTVAYGTSTLTSFRNKMYLLKMDAAGNIVWARKPSQGINRGNAISCDNAGNVYVSGSFDSTTVIGNFTLTAATGTSNVFIAKFDGNGNVLWAKKSTGTMGDGSYGISTDANGNSYITGNFYSPIISFGTFTLAGGGNANIFLVKYDASGNELWARRGIGTGTLDMGYSVSQDGNGGIYIAGSYDSPSLVIGSTTLTNANPGDMNMFIAKYNASGNALWAKSSSGVYNEAYCVSSYSAGAFITGPLDYTTGIFGTYTLNAPIGSFDPGFLIHYDVNGNETFATAFTSGGDDYFGVAFDKFCNAYISGDFAVNPFVVGNSTLTLSGLETSFLAKLVYTCQIIPDGLEDKNADSFEPIIYPNPNQSNYTIVLDASNSIQTMQLLNSMGEVVYTQQFAPNTKTTYNDVSIPINLKGAFVAKIISGNKVLAVKKLIVN